LTQQLKLRQNIGGIFVILVGLGIKTSLILESNPKYTNALL